MASFDKNGHSGRTLERLELDAERPRGGRWGHQAAARPESDLQKADLPSRKRTQTDRPISAQPAAGRRALAEGQLISLRNVDSAYRRESLSARYVKAGIPSAWFAMPGLQT